MSFIRYPKVHLRDLVNAFWRGTENVRWVFFAAICLLTAVEAINVSIPLFYKRFFDTLEASQPGSGFSELASILLIVLGLNLSWWFLNWLGRLCVSVGETKAIANLKQQAFDYSIQHSTDFFANTFTGSMVSRVKRYADSFERLADTIAYNFIPLVINIGGAIVVVSFIQPLLALVLVTWTLLFLALNYFYSKWRLKHNIELAQLDSESTGVLADSITNQSSITLFSAFPFENARYKEITDKFSAKLRFMWNSNVTMDALQNLFVVSVEFIILYLALFYWEQSIATIGTFVLLQIYVLQIGSKINTFGRIIRDVYEVHARATEMVEILKLPHGIQDTKNAKELVVTNGTISFEKMSFNFNETRSLFKNLDLTIAGAQKIGLVGSSGSGKTTLAQLLLRLHDVTSGSICIDSQAIQKVTQASLRKMVSFVPQEPMLFHRSIRENIRYGRPSATDEEVELAAKQAQAHEFILETQGGYDTYVGERGIKLSGGQRQRIAIARAILKNAPILVLDEATSALDSESEVEIQKALHELMQGKTVIAIAHRLSTLREMDRIIVLDKGKIVQDGSHDELLKEEKGVYARLWAHQAGGFLQEDE